ncbi:MAG: hypothetical protein AABW81_02740 [Nanoarchaeota archaeon]
MKIYGCGILQERELQKDLAKKCSGDVLVARYGFGIIVKSLIKNKKVRSITIAEKNKEVIDELRKNDKIIGKIIINDFYNLSENKKFDCIVGDIWQDIDAKFLKDYLRFKRKSRKLLKDNGKILAWGQDYFEFLIKNNKSNSLS